MSEHKLQGAPPHTFKPAQRAFGRLNRLQDPGAVFSVTLILGMAVLFIWIGL